MGRSGIRIGRLFGIDIRIDWSWLVIFLLVTWNLASIFGQYHSDWGVALRWGTGVFAALLFFGSVLAHELAHSLVARTQGVDVRSITLFLFGGVSNIQRDPESPGAEFLITIVGPLTSFIVGILFILASGLSSGTLQGSLQNPGQAIGQMSPLSTLLVWLGPINIVLGIFNLIPGFPLDGGRVFRSIIWGITGDLRRATYLASMVGRGIAWLMILAGISMVFGFNIPLLGTGLISGLWLAFIGWFLDNASQQSYRQIVVQDVLEGVTVSRMMRSDSPTASPEITVENLVHERVMKSDEHAFPVMEGDQLVGIVCLDDVRSVPRSEWGSTRVRDIMTPRGKLVVVDTDEDAGDALRKMAEADVRQLPVLHDQRLEGMLRRRDVMRFLQLQSDSARRR
jgi:Zn-dependent protease/CBS domain-containing protein